MKYNNLDTEALQQVANALGNYITNVNQNIKRMEDAAIDCRDNMGSDDISKKSIEKLEASTVSLKVAMREAEELKKELTGQLLEYQECKKMAAIMSKQIDFDSFCREPSQIEYDMTYNLIHLPTVLQEAYIRAVGKGKKKLPPPSEACKGIVARRIVPVGAKIVHVIRFLRKNGNCRYAGLFADSSDRSELVATFLAVLELVKGKRIRVEGDGDEASVILIERKS